jgi:hypothetical protein
VGAVSKFSQPNFIFNRAPKYKLYWMRSALNRRAVERKLAIFKEKMFTKRPQSTESLVATNNTWRASAFVPWYEDAFETSQNLLVRWREAWGRPYVRRLQHSAIGAVKLWSMPYGFMKSNTQPRQELVRWPNISSGTKITRIVARNPRSRVGAAFNFEKHWNPEHQKTIRASEEKRVTAAVRATYPLYLMPESAERTLIPDFFETIPVRWMRNAGAFHNKLVYELPQMLNCINSTLRSGVLMTPAEKRAGHRFSAEPTLPEFVSNFRKTKLLPTVSMFQAKILRVAFNAKYSRWLALLGGHVKRNVIRKRFQRLFWDNWETPAVEKTTDKWLPWFKQHKYSVVAREWLFGFLANPIYFRREEGVEPDTFSQYPRRAHFTRWPLRFSFKQVENAIMTTDRIRSRSQKKVVQKTTVQTVRVNQKQLSSQTRNTTRASAPLKSAAKLGVSIAAAAAISTKPLVGTTTRARAMSTLAENNSERTAPVEHLYSRKNVTRTKMETEFTEFGRFCPTFEKEQPWLGRLALETSQADTQRKHDRTLLRRNMYLCSRLFPTVFSKALVRKQQIKTIAPHAQGIATQTRTVFWSLRFSLSEKTARIRWYTRRVWPAWRRATYRKTDAIRNFRNWDAKFLRPSALQEKIFRRCFHPYLLFPRYRNRPGIGFWFRFVMPRLYDFWTENPALFNELGLPKTHLVRVRTRSSLVHHWDTQARFGGCEHMLRTLLLTKSGFPRLEKYLHTRIHVGLDVLGDRQKFLVHLPVFEESVTPHPLHLSDDQNQYVREAIAYRTPEERAALKPRPLIQLRVPSLMAQMFKRREYFSTATAFSKTEAQLIKTLQGAGPTGPLLRKLVRAVIKLIKEIHWIQEPHRSKMISARRQQLRRLVKRMKRKSIPPKEFLRQIVKAAPTFLRQAAALYIGKKDLNLPAIKRWPVEKQLFRLVTRGHPRTLFAAVPKTRKKARVLRRAPSRVTQMFRRREYFPTAMPISAAEAQLINTVRWAGPTGPLLRRLVRAVIKLIKATHWVREPHPSKMISARRQRLLRLVKKVERKSIAQKQFLLEIVKTAPALPKHAAAHYLGKKTLVQPRALARAAAQLPAAEGSLIEEQLFRLITSVNSRTLFPVVAQTRKTRVLRFLPPVVELLAIIHGIDRRSSRAEAPARRGRSRALELLAWAKKYFATRATTPWFTVAWAWQILPTTFIAALDEAAVRSSATFRVTKPQNEDFSTYLACLSAEQETHRETTALSGRTPEDKNFTAHVTCLSENQETRWKTLILPGRAPEDGPMPAAGTKTCEISTQQHFLVQNTPYRGRAMEIWRPFIPARFDRYRPWLWERITTQHWKKGRVMRHFFSRAERFSRRRYWTNIPYSYYYAKRSRLRPLIWREWDTTFDNDDLYRGFSFNRAERRRARWLEVLMYRRALYSSNRRPYRRYNFPKGYASLRWLQKYRKAAANGLRSRRYLRRRRWRMVQTCNRKMFLKMFHFPHIRAAQKHFCKTSKKAPGAGQSGFGRMTRGLVSRVDVNLLILNIVGTVFWARALVFCGFLWLDNVLATTGGSQLLPDMRLGFEWGTIDHFFVYFKKVQWSYKKFPQLLTPCARLANLPKHFKASHRTHVVIYSRAPRYGDITLRSRFNAIMFCLFQVSAGQGH